MVIYNIDDFRDKERIKERDEVKSESLKDHIRHITQKKEAFHGKVFSSLAARFFFVLFLIADVFWGFYSFICLMLKLILNLVTGFRIRLLRDSLKFSWLSVKRSLICFVALFIALFSPALGILFACLYFLMYDKAGMDEVVPSSFKDQFQGFFPS